MTSLKVPICNPFQQKNAHIKREKVRLTGGEF